MISKIYVYIMFVFLLISSQVTSSQLITISTSEQAPYIGDTLPNKGYVYELTTEAFKRVGYDVRITFYPLARAKAMAETGEVDAVLPVYYNKQEENNLAFSSPFQGTTTCLLKKNL